MDAGSSTRRGAAIPRSAYPDSTSQPSANPGAQVWAGPPPTPGARGQSYQQRNFGQGLASQGVTDRPSLNSKTTGPDRVLPPIAPPTTKFKMRGRDPDCGGIVYRTWVVTGAPDFMATSYVGARCGATPLSDVVVVDSWLES